MTKQEKRTVFTLHDIIPDATMNDLAFLGFSYVLANSIAYTVKNAADQADAVKEYVKEVAQMVPILGDLAFKDIPTMMHSVFASERNVLNAHIDNWNRHADTRNALLVELSAVKNNPAEAKRLKALIDEEGRWMEAIRKKAGETVAFINATLQEAGLDGNMPNPIPVVV